MGVYEIGTRPTNVQVVSSDTDVKVGDIYGAEMSGIVWSFLPPGTFEEKLAQKWWNKIKEKGDSPLYVRVEARVIDYGGGIMVRHKYATNVTIFARKKSSGTPIHLILFAIASIILSLSWLISQVDEWRYNTWYYKTYEKPPEKPSEGITSLAGLGGLLLLIIILHILSKRR